MQFVEFNFSFDLKYPMKEPFPRLETVYDPDRKKDTRYGGAVIVKRMWDCARQRVT